MISIKKIYRKLSKQYILKHLHNLLLRYIYKYYSKKSKIFGIGLNKTGTSSLGDYFENLGYYHSFETYTVEKLNKFLTNDSYLFNEADSFDMHEDWPWAFVYKKLFFKYPDAKFILTLRESSEKWFNSLLNTTVRFGPCAQNKIFYGSEEIYPEMREKLIEQYDTHALSVKEFFKEKNALDKLLILKTDDPHKEKKICSFLGISVDENIKYPHKNKGKYINAK